MAVLVLFEFGLAYHLLGGFPTSDKREGPLAVARALTFLSHFCTLCWGHLNTRKPKNHPCDKNTKNGYRLNVLERLAEGGAMGPNGKINSEDKEIKPERGSHGLTKKMGPN